MPNARCRNSRCREWLEITIDRLGNVTATCAACTAWQAGRCVDCSAQRERRVARRCDACRTARQRAKRGAYSRRSYRKHASRRRAYGREYMLRPEVRAKKIARLKQWRREHPYGVAMQKRRERTKMQTDPTYRAKRLAYYQRWRERQKEQTV